jgi:hypothetical protein
VSRPVAAAAAPPLPLHSTLCRLSMVEGGERSETETNGRVSNTSMVATATDEQQQLMQALMWRSVGGLESSEFESGTPPTEEEIRVAFDGIDSDDDGFVTEQELLKAVTRGWGENESLETVKEMIDAADQTGDGKIDFGEFRQIIQG